MICKYIKHDESQEFILEGKLDQESYSEFDDFISLNYASGSDVVINVTGLSYISSVGLRSFIGLAKLVRNDKKNIHTRAQEGSMVKQLIVLSGFVKLMPFIE